MFANTRVLALLFILKLVKRFKFYVPNKYDTLKKC